MLKINARGTSNLNLMRLVLWRSTLMPASAPIAPIKNATMISVDSLVRQVRFLALALSIPYIANVTMFHVTNAARIMIWHVFMIYLPFGRPLYMARPITKIHLIYKHRLHPWLLLNRFLRNFATGTVALAGSLRNSELLYRAP